jgi:hypothetical protein
VAGLEHGKWTLAGSGEAASPMAREVRGTDPSVVVARDFRALAELQALAALVGTRSSAADAVLTPSPVASPNDPSGRGVAAYSLLSNTPARWHQADDGSPVYVDTQSGGHPQFAGGGLTQLSQAAALWSGAGSLRLQNGLARSARCFDNT